MSLMKAERSNNRSGRHDHAIGAIRLLGALLFATLASGQSRAADLTPLVGFDGSNGQSPYVGNLLADANGNLFGTALPSLQPVSVIMISCSHSSPVGGRLADATI
jgi:hypothetical protein